MEEITLIGCEAVILRSDLNKQKLILMNAKISYSIRHYTQIPWTYMISVIIVVNLIQWGLSLKSCQEGESNTL